MRDVNGFALGEDHGPLDDPLQLSNVGVSMLQQQLQRARRQVFGGASMRLAVDCEEVIDQDRNVVGAPFVANAQPYDTRNAIDMQFSLPFSMALVAHRVPPDARWQSQQTLENAQLHGFARRVHIHADPRAFEHKLAEPSSWWARVEVTTRDGKRATDERVHARGSNGTAFALSDAEISAKFLGNASIRLQQSQAEALLTTLWSLDRAPGMGRLGGLLVPEAKFS
jgi:hypothetical protein